MVYSGAVGKLIREINLKLKISGQTNFKCLWFLSSKSEFVNEPRIDIPTASLSSLAESIPGSLNIYKFGLSCC
jgi:hypothetical protein